MSCDLCGQPIGGPGDGVCVGDAGTLAGVRLAHVRCVAVEAIARTRARRRARACAAPPIPRRTGQRRP